MLDSMKNHFLYTVLNTAAPLERMAEKNSSNGGQEKKSAASEVHYGRNFLILYKHYKAFFPKSRNLVLKVLVLH